MDHSTDDLSSLFADSSVSAHSAFRSLIDTVRCEAEHWVHELLVTIGRASMISGLKESQIRYYEELNALQPATTTGRAGASRLYSLSDLRRLRLLALLITQAGIKPAEAADLVTQYADHIDHGAPVALDAALVQERHAVADGFFLARILSQVICALEAEVAELFADAPERLLSDTPPPPLIVGLLYPGRAWLPADQPWTEAIPLQAAALCANAAETLVALCPQPQPVSDDTWAPELLTTTGSDLQTLLFYSAEARTLSSLTPCSFLAYIPTDAPERALLLALRAPLPADHAPILDPAKLLPGRAQVLDRMLNVTQAILNQFRAGGTGRGLRYRSDGFPLHMTRQSYDEMLGLIANVVFPNDPTSMAVVLIPDGLDEPTSLSILAYHGYDDDLAARAKISLTGNGQGLSGRAYVLQEPFVSLHAHTDRRVRYGPEEDCRAALAIPLKATWGVVPFGVLYVASRRSEQSLDSTAMFSALALGGILSELLGRWWLTRLRKAQDLRLHQNHTRMLEWLDSLDAHGPGFERGIAALMQLSAQSQPHGVERLNTPVALVVLDINHYRATIQVRSNDPFPIYAQHHVRKAVQRVLTKEFPHCYWFGNDHALLILDDYDRERAKNIVERIADQVADTPVRLPHSRRSPYMISLSAAIKMISYRSLHDFGRDGPAALHQHLTELVDFLRTEAGGGAPQTRIVLVDR
jgi:DNA-binding transcriptional MerR regulator/GGDEF domain-containing protein